MIPLHVTLSHYKRREIQEEIVTAAKLREIAVRYEDSFGKRPDILVNAADILELAKQKATSFHFSEELWRNPMRLAPSLRKQELDELRLGWDLVIDIDCSVFEYSRIAADLVIKALRYYDIQAVSCKFSGNKGFHIGVPFEAFPEVIQGKKTVGLFPEAARHIALYLKEMIKKPLSKEIMKYENGDFSVILQKTDGKKEELITTEVDEHGYKVSVLNAEPFLAIDTILISSRHLFRSPYSLHEKSGLVSIPLDPEKVLEFERNDAASEKVIVSKFRFLDRDHVRKGEGMQLLTQALDFALKEEKNDRKGIVHAAIENAIPEQFFPPCMQLLAKGISDGKKRAVFAMVNFLSSIGWSYDQIENYLREWNKRNPEPLRETILVGQIRYHKQQGKKIMPPNCNNAMYYKAIGVCRPDEFCKRIRNPASYAIKKAQLAQQEASKTTRREKKKAE